MQVGSTTGSAEAITLLQGSSANPSEQASRQVQQQLQTVSQETSQQTEAAQATGNVGQNINTTA